MGNMSFCTGVLFLFFHKINNIHIKQQQQKKPSQLSLHNLKVLYLVSLIFIDSNVEL